MGDAAGAVLIGAKQDLESIPKQFISVDELLRLFAKLEKITIEEAAQWFVRHQSILKYNASLVYKNNYTLVRYEYNDRNFYNSPIETIKLIAEGEEGFPTDCIGFSRYLILHELKSQGLKINSNLIDNSCPFFDENCHEGDESFYKNQSTYLKKDLDRLKGMNAPIAQKEDIPRLHFLDKNHSCYVPIFALILQLNQDVNYTERYDDKKVQKDRIFAFLEEYGEHYGYTATETRAAVLAQIIPNRKAAKIKAAQAIGRALVQEIEF